MKGHYLIKGLLLFFVVMCLGMATNSWAEEKLELNLNQAVKMALRANTRVKEAFYNLKASKAGEKSALFDMFPKIGAEYNYVHLRDEPYVYMNMGPIPQKMATGYTNTYSWDVYIVQPLFTGFALYSKHKIASLASKIEDLRKQQVKLDVAYEVKEAYFNLLLAEKKLRVREEDVSSLQAHLKDARNFYHQGLIPKNDLLKSEVAYSLSKQNLARAKSDLIVARANLNRILNRNLDLPIEVEDISSIPPLRGNLDSFIKKALVSRPEIKALNKGIREAKYYIKMAKSTFYPSISLFGKYQREGGNVFATTNKFSNEKNLALGINAKWEFFASGKDFEKVRESKYKLMALMEKKKTIEALISLQVKRAYENLMVARANMHTAKASLSQAKENFRITNEGYKVQINTSTDVLDARSYLTQAEMRYYAALYGYHIALAALHRAIGVY